MKHLLSILAVAIIIVVAWGCSSGGSEVIPVTLSQGALSFSSDAGKQTIEVTAGSNWEPQSSKDWCTVQRDGKQLVVSVTKNYAAKDRTATVTITSGEQSAVLGVTQKKGSGKFDGFEVTTLAFEGLEPTGGDDVVVSSKQDTYNLRVVTKDSKYSWKAEVVEGSDFVSVPDNDLHKGSGYLDFTVHANNTIEERKAQLKIVSELEGAYCTYLLKITQQAANNNEDPIINNEIDW